MGKMKFLEFLFRKKNVAVASPTQVNSGLFQLSPSFTANDQPINKAINDLEFKSSLSTISEDSLEPSSSPGVATFNSTLKRRSCVNGNLKREIFFSDEIVPVAEQNLDDSAKAASSKDSDSSKSSLNENQYNNMLMKYKLFSIIYGMIIIVLGVILPIVETAMRFIVEYKQDSDDIFEIVLFSLSIVWFIYCFFDINLFKRRRKLVSDFDSQIYSHDTNRTTGGLYIKIGCGFFCMASLLQNGLLLAEAFEFQNFCGSPVVFVKNLLRFIFTFLQYAFLFKNSHVLIQSKLLITHLSISHIIVTNICVWFRFILEETFDSVKYATNSRLQSTGFRNQSSREPNSSWKDQNSSFTSLRQLSRLRQCTQLNTQVSDIIEHLSPYLIPCAIEYSIICVTLFYIIWYNVGRRVGRVSENQEEQCTRRFSLVAAQTQIFHVDCNKSAKGLFAGFLIALLTIIALIIFVVSGASEEASADSFKLLALYLSESIELLVLLLCLLVALDGFISMRKMGLARVKPNFSISLEATLEIFALFGVLSFGVFRILSFRYTTNRSAFLYLFFINGILSFIQGLVQTVFILQGLEKRSTTGTELKRKKGREQISFLIILNICLWLLYTVTRNKYAYNLFQEVLNSNTGGNSEYLSEYVRSNQHHANNAMVERFGYTNSSSSALRSIALTITSSGNAQSVKWIIINTITYPLLLYFHFHSSCCLSIMWKLCYHLEVDSF